MPTSTPARVVVATLVLATAACTTPVTVPVAPQAAHPLCADVVLALPDDLGDLQRVRTGSQATAAWGDRGAPVVLRCGVAPPGPSTEHCVSADDGATSVDWIAVPGSEGEGGTTDWTFTTYGREPAVEVQVPAAVTNERSTSFLLDLGPAVAQVEQRRACL
ncbi:DUF3515 domain-containing protein [Cellulomonas bogoriensis]|uniref:DUF3515 domain-containing protein n=1 Tax=Cellulomonas bogoriensis 69B4 = DSM 16987 TaxID=1386082 RepID=A0A0A0BYH5_9CELL|nr:DUF3515 domain-containing protein [Cellulomonas bogoriensis]KGM12986.1 hypothetical protein N869_16885 [Cellulomonas bogoriensis 69B4 = DSM 16987]